MLQHKDNQKVGTAETEWSDDGCQVPVKVHERDRYGHLGGVFACMSPVDGPVRALGVRRGGFASTDREAEGGGGEAGGVH